jgi:periodic tryptophan protein 2
MACAPFAPSAPAVAPQINLTQSVSSTLPFENAKQIRTLAVSPDGRLLLSIDEDGRALVINRKRR